MSQVGAFQRDRLRSEADDKATVGISDSMRHHFLAITARSQLNRVMCSDLSQEDNCMLPGDFIAGCRWYLGPPPLVVWGNATVVVAGIKLEFCGRTGHEDLTKDPSGDHLAGCPST